MNRFLLFFFCILFFVTAKGQSNYAEAMQQGDDAFKKGQYKTAINKYFAAEAFDPSKKDIVKEKINKAFDKIEALRAEAEIAKKRAVTALNDKTKAELEQQKTQKEKEEIDKNLQLIKNTNKIVAQKLLGLSDSADETTKEILVEIQDILLGLTDTKTKIPPDTVSSNNGHTINITVDHLIAIAGARTKLMDSLAYWINRICPKYEINTPQEYAHFLAQCCFESDQFRTLTEYGSGKAYEGREDLGNNNPGDGVKYKGRGLIQRTGKSNYLQLGIIRGDRELFINNPDLLAHPEYAVWAACEYWKARGLNDIASHLDSDSLSKKYRSQLITVSPVEYISITINGGYNGIEERKKLYELAKKALQ